MEQNPWGGARLGIERARAAGTKKNQKHKNLCKKKCTSSRGPSCRHVEGEPLVKTIAARSPSTSSFFWRPPSYGSASPRPCAALSDGKKGTDCRCRALLDKAAPASIPGPSGRPGLGATGPRVRKCTFSLGKLKVSRFRGCRPRGRGSESVGFP